MGGNRSDKEKTAGASTAPPDGALPEAPSAATSAKATHTVSDALRDKVNLLIPDNTGRRDRTIKALEAGKVVHVGAHKLKGDRIPDKQDGDGK